MELNEEWGKQCEWAAVFQPTSATLGFGGSGGVFAPSLLMGAALGSFMGAMWQNLLPGLISDVGAYALVGMGAVVSGVTHTPISSIPTH